MSATLGSGQTYNKNTPSQGGGGDGSSSSVLLQEILAELQALVEAGQVHVFIDYLICAAGGTFQRMYNSSKPVKGAIIQNVSASATDVITVSSVNGNSGGGNATAGQANILNPPNISGQGGGSLPFPNGDLYELWWTGTTTGDAIAVIYWT